MSVAERVVDGLGPAFQKAAGPVLDDLAGGLTSELETADLLATPTPGGWSAAFDLVTTPDPAWLGSATGTTVPAGLTLEEQRAYVRERPAWRRGSLDAMASAVRTLLAAPSRVGFAERHDANAWRLRILVYAADASGITEAQVLAAAATQKPVGLVLDGVTVVPAVTYDDLAGMYDDYAALEVEGWGYPLTLEDDIPGIRWWRPASRITRYARTRVIAPTYAERSARFPTYRSSRDHDPQEA
ncbi:hypothetical protein [Nocardioides soli]|uniref:Uncharacterized protein n=1 Tax=Nocardioides soli TaxID=1036020 RepID=A0A7W4VSK2_9ACTN|nr:hypothetical protein [Nocardioides soli]MBB3041032.1 hypothetical protein [Nocardioides soli]